ncbi:uncharacterized protein ACNS7B_020329 [Menidia menidia]
MRVRCLGFAVLVCTTGVLHGSPLSSGSNKGDTGLLFTTQSCSTDGNNKPNITTVDNCGQFPVVKDGVNYQVGNCSLKYECVKYYKLEGSENVVCYSDGTWSQIPTCRANYCSVNTTNYDDLKSTGVAFIANGSTKRLECVDKFQSQNYALVKCEDGKLNISKCCNMVQINTNTCWIRDPPCVMDPHKYRRYGLELPSPIYLNEDERKYLPASSDCRIAAHCVDRKIYLGWCCSSQDPDYRQCRWNPIE